MRKIYILAACVAVSLSANAGGQRFKSIRGQKNVKKIMRAEASAPLWRPASQTDYMHDGDGWMKMGEVSFKYDKRGNCTEELVDEDGYLSKTVTTYDEFNFPLTVVKTESEDGETWENSGKTTYVYDARIHGFFTDRSGFDWTDGDWVRNYRCEGNAITRNSDGNIVELVKSLPLMDEMKPAYKSVWTYGDDGKANGYAYYTVAEDGGWDLYDDISYKDIVWETTDGQMTVYGDLLELTEGKNLLKSAVVYYNDEPDGHYIVDYYDGSFGFLIKETTNDVNEVGRTIVMLPLDANGSMRLTTTEYFDEEGNILAEPTYIDVQEALMDEHGNMVLFSEKETIEGEEELIASTKYSYTYDANGNPTEIIAEEYDYETQEYFPSERTVYGEYVDVAASGIRDFNAGTSEAEQMIFDINGRRVAEENMQPGSIYIVNGKKIICR